MFAAFVAWYPCRQYFAVLVNLKGRTNIGTAIPFTDTLNGACTTVGVVQRTEKMIRRGISLRSRSRQAMVEGGSDTYKATMTTIGNPGERITSTACILLNRHSGHGRIKLRQTSEDVFSPTWRPRARTPSETF